MWGMRKVSSSVQDKNQLIISVELILSPTLKEKSKYSVDQLGSL